MDVVHTVEQVPGPNEKVVALETTTEAGGPALNAAVTASLLGMPPRLVSAVGRAVWGQVVRQDCASHDVALVDVAGEAFDLPVSTVLVTASTGERAVVSRNALGAPTVAAPSAMELGGLLAGVTAVLVDGHHLALGTAVARAARERGIPVLLDGGSWKPGLQTLLAHVDVLVASADFHVPAHEGAGDLDSLLALGPTWVARTAGADAVRWMAREGTAGNVPVPQLQVVDTLGAGDVLHGALLADLGRRGTGDLPGSLAFAVDVASRSVTAAGARGWAARHPQG